MLWGISQYTFTNIAKPEFIFKTAHGKEALMVPFHACATAWVDEHETITNDECSKRSFRTRILLAPFLIKQLGNDNFQRKHEDVERMKGHGICPRGAARSWHGGNESQTTHHQHDLHDTWGDEYGNMVDIEISASRSAGRSSTVKDSPTRCICKQILFQDMRFERARMM